MVKALLAGFILTLLLSGCGGSESNNDSDGGDDSTSLSIDFDAPVTEGDWYHPSLLVTWQWQLQGTINTSYVVEVYDIDLFDASTTEIAQIQASGRKVICYFSAGSYEEWRDDAPSFPAAALGNALDGWEGERWLDIRSVDIENIMVARLDLAAAKGCDGVEPDNMDGYTNSPGFSLTAQDQLAYNRFIANAAHARELSVGLKNDLDQIEDLVEYYDFAVNEQCFEYDECDLLTPFTDAEKPVLNAEYKQAYVDDAATRNALCTDSVNRQFSTLILPLDLDDSFRLSCI